MFQRRPVGLWTTRSTEFPTSPTGLHYYYEFRQSSSTQNDEGPMKRSERYGIFIRAAGAASVRYQRPANWDGLWLNTLVACDFSENWGKTLLCSPCNFRKEFTTGRGKPARA